MSKARALRALFEREQMLERQLAAVRNRIAIASRAYADERGYLVTPRPETLRREVGLSR